MVKRLCDKTEKLESVIQDLIRDARANVSDEESDQDEAQMTDTQLMEHYDRNYIHMDVSLISEGISEACKQGRGNDFSFFKIISDCIYIDNN